jgi:hypothetical protein
VDYLRTGIKEEKDSEKTQIKERRIYAKSSTRFISKEMLIL